MTQRDLRRHLTQAALELAAILNIVEDDDERDELHGHVEKVINDELYAGSLNRSHAAEHAARVFLHPLSRFRGAPVVDLFSRKVH